MEVTEHLFLSWIMSRDNNRPVNMGNPLVNDLPGCLMSEFAKDYQYEMPWVNYCSSTGDFGMLWVQVVDGKERLRWTKQSKLAVRPDSVLIPGWRDHNPRTFGEVKKLLKL